MRSKAPRLRWTAPTLTPLRLGLSVMLLAAADAGSQLAGNSTIPGGPLDETAHFLTTLLFLWALPPRILRRFGVPALIASVLIDVDHIPDRLGAHFLTAGTPRPYTHSLLTLGALVALSLVWRRRRDALLGTVLGLTIHFWRDLSEPGSGVALLWPLTDRSFSLPHAVYVAAMAAIALAAWRAANVSRPASAGKPLSRPQEG